MRSRTLTIPEIILFNSYSCVLNNWGIPRVDAIRKFFPVLSQEHIDQLVAGFRFWRDFPEYILLKGEKFDKKPETKYLAVKCSKRGNDVFSRRLNHKLGFLASKKFEKKEFFNVDDWQKGKKTKSRLLWVTLTFDSKRCSLNDAWKGISKEYNLWITNLRNRYGRIMAFKNLQGFPDPEGNAFSYPHIHVALLFLDHEFNTFPRNEYDEEGRLGIVWRVEEKDELHDQGKWHSFSDVKAISSMRGLLNYCRKHGQNSVYGDSEESTLNCALTWFFNKHTYSLSKGFREALSEFIISLHNSKTFFQETLVGSGKLVWTWVFLGVWSGVRLKVDGVDWVLKLDGRAGQQLEEEYLRRKNLG